MSSVDGYEENKHDTTYLEKALKEANRRRGKVLIDGIADSQKCYELTQRYNEWPGITAR